MARTKTDTFKQIKLKAEVQNVAPSSSYGYDSETVAELETTIRLGGRFDREQVATLVTSIVNQLVAAFDEGEVRNEEADVELGDEPEPERELGQLS